MNYVSVCSGIEAATSAWHGMGWKPLAFSEIEKFPSAVLAHHYPDVINEGDFTTIGDKYDLTNGLLVGGTPCQDFSVAGLRAGLDGERGNLSTEFVKLAYQSNAKWILWENVPGVLSSGSGQDFATILSGFTGCEIQFPKEKWRNSGIIQGAEGCYSVAWRVLDAQYFGVAQRRRRVFVVGYSGNWQHPAAVLFERNCLQGNPTPSREKGKGVTPDAEGSVRVSSEVAGTLRARDYKGPATDSLCTGGNLCIEPRTHDNGIVPTPNTMSGGQREHGICVGSDCYNGAITGEVAMTLKHADGNPAINLPPCIQPVYSFIQASDKAKATNAVKEEVNNTLFGDGGNNFIGGATAQVRRLTPVECERLQGFPDDFTKIPYRGKDADKCPDGPRYKALGNSMAVPCMKWIGERIEKVEAL